MNDLPFPKERAFCLCKYQVYERLSRGGAGVSLHLISLRGIESKDITLVSNQNTKAQSNRNRYTL